MYLVSCTSHGRQNIMIDFGRSYFTWKSKPILRHPDYKYPGFEGTEGAVHKVRIQLDSACTLTNEKTGEKQEYFLVLSCQTEYTIVKENLFQIPSSEWRMLFGAKKPSRSPMNLAMNQRIGSDPGSAIYSPNIASRFARSRMPESSRRMMRSSKRCIPEN